MKYIKTFTFLLLSSIFTLYACNNKADANKQEESESQEVTNTMTPPDGMTAEPAQNAEGVWHYTCSKGCKGGAGAAGTCTTCGGPLAHNAAYHGNANTPPANPMTPPTTPSPEPAQNAAGVWHYTCEKGCKGGAGTAGLCAGCGGNLTHNAAYHQ